MNELERGKRIDNLDWKMLYMILYPDVKLKLDRYSALKRNLKRIGIRLYKPEDSKGKTPLICDISNLQKEEHGITLEEFIRYRFLYCPLHKWMKKYGISYKDFRWLTRKKLIPYIRIGGRVYVPESFNPTEILYKETQKKLAEIEEEVRNLAEGSINCIVFPNWRKYKDCRVKKAILSKFAAERRLLRVGNTYAILVSLVGKTLDDLLAEENNNIENLVYFIKHKTDVYRFKQSKVKEIVDITKL